MVEVKRTRRTCGDGWSSWIRFEMLLTIPVRSWSRGQNRRGRKMRRGESVYEEEGPSGHDSIIMMIGY